MKVKTRLDIPRRLQGQLWRYGQPVGEPRSHRHVELELEHVVQGRATLAVDGRRLDLRPRDLVFLQPGLEHQVIDPSDDFEMWIACFRPRLAQRACGPQARRALLSRHAPAPAARTLNANEARRLAGLLAEVSAYEDPAAYNAGLAHLLAHAWLQYCQAED